MCCGQEIAKKARITLKEVIENLTQCKVNGVKKCQGTRGRDPRGGTIHAYWTQIENPMNPIGFSIGIQLDFRSKIELDFSNGKCENPIGLFD